MVASRAVSAPAGPASAGSGAGDSEKDGPGKGVRTPAVLLVGNPNSGKTTLFNELTRSRYKVANYPGVTVEKKVGRLAVGDGRTAEIYDLPGIYTLHGQSEDERIAEAQVRQSVKAGDLLIAVIDASSLERSLYLVAELRELGARFVVALTMTDLAKRDGLEILDASFERELGAPIVSLALLEKRGLDRLTDLVRQQLAVETESQSANGTVRAAGVNYGDPSPAVTDESAVIGMHPGTDEAASRRYRWVRHVLERSVRRPDRERTSRSERLDRLVLHPVFGFIVFLAIMAFVFQAVFAWASWPMDLIESTLGGVAKAVTKLLPEGQLRSLIVDGIIAGVGSVVVFVPQIAILFFLIGLLEQSGYLCRAAVLMDRLMRVVGLQGRSFIPLLSSFACAVPGIMATRSIPSRGDRLLTILVAPLMSCSARLPVYTVLIGAFVPAIYLGGVVSVPGLVLFSLYALGIVAAALVALVMKRFFLRAEPALFVMELPRYRIPCMKTVLLEVWDRVVIFLKNAGTIILACSLVLWFLASYPRDETGAAPQLRKSFAGQLGAAIEPVITPLGYNWEIGVSLLASFAAREVFVSSLGTLYNLDDADSGVESLSTVLAERASTGEGFGLATAFSLLAFYALACQCMSTLAVVRRETASWGWPFFLFAYMTVLAYLTAFVTYRSMLWLGFS